MPSHPVLAFVAAPLALSCFLTGSASAAFATLHSSTVNLTSLGGTPVSSFATYTATGGGQTDFPFTGLTGLSQSGTGAAEWWMADLGSMSIVGARYAEPNGGGSYAVTLSWDITLSSGVGGTGFVELFNLFHTTLGTLTVTPSGGSSSSTAVGAVFADGRYTFTWDYTETGTTGGVSQSLWFQSGSPPPGGGGGGGVPASPAAAFAAVGLIGLAGLRRRR